MLIVPDRIFEGLCEVEHKDDVGDCQETYPESLIKIRHFCQRKGKLGTCRMLMVPDQRLEG